jgi:transposase
MEAEPMALEYNQILELVCQGRSYREIADTLGCSHRDVSRVSKAVHEHHITHPSQVSAADLASWFPDGRSRISQTYQRPAWDSVLHAMRAQPHFTLLMAWRRYVDAGGNARKYGYSQFCALFADYVRRNDLVAVLHHEPGRAMLVDWAGDTMEVLDEATGEVTRVYLFVAVLPFSGALFARGYPDMKSPAWLDAHAQAFEFFAGVPQIVVPDNPTTSTIRPVRGDTERRINTRYQELADHYGTAIVPARVRKPRDKAAAERAVNVIGTRVIGYLEAETWTSPAELNEAIDTRVAEINHDMVRADGSTRWARFTDEEKPLLGPLPPTRFTEVWTE